MNTPRGIRNLNPGNLERNGIPWQGLATVQSDPRFLVFIAMPWGVRAAGKVLLTYYRKYGLNTVAGIINRWAPPVENDSGAYIAAVSKALGVRQDQAMKIDAPATLTRLLRAIFHHENGGHFVSEVDIADGVRLALGGKP